jgi:hypothetical protein
MSRPLSVAIAAIALAIAPGLAKADVVSFTGSTTGSDPVSYSGSISVTPGAGTSATVQISLTNTTSTGDAVQYGYITGFGFNVPGSTTVSGTPSATDTDFKFLTAAANTTSLQAGEFTYAWSTNASQLHTVATSEISKGLAAGQSATFTVTLNNAAGLTAAAIANATAPAGAPFSVRFRSTNTSLYLGHNSPDGDKVPFTITPSQPPPSGVPAPAGLVLGLIGAGCFIGRNHRRKIAVKS